ncbi:MAG TPA: regulatory protein RecX [Chitinophagaceae bacterium]
MQKKNLTKEQALQKLRHYCRYQERCHHEVEQKLWELGVKRSFHDEIISVLIEEGDLNEERFAVHFAGGKFRMLQWGKKKIYYALKEKKVSEYSIKKALITIEEDQYLETIKRLAEKKYNILKEEQYLVRKKKTVDYLLQKGFESALVNKIIKELTSSVNK